MSYGRNRDRSEDQEPRMEHGRRSTDAPKFSARTHGQDNSSHSTSYSSIKTSVAIQMAVSLTIGINLAGLSYTIAKVEDIATTVHEIKNDVKEYETRLRSVEVSLYNDGTDYRTGRRQGK